MKRAALFVLMTAVLAAPGCVRAKEAAKAPSPSVVNLDGGKSGTPLEVYADDGMELSQDMKTITAHGNAKAIRGNVTVTSATLVAYYRDKPGNPASTGRKAASPAPGGQESGSEVWRIEAIDHVTIASPTETVYGDHADYNIDDDMVVVTGNDLRMVTATDLVTARDSLEYWNQKQVAVARGKAVAARAGKSIAADILTADFAKDSDGKMAISKAHADKNVVLTTPTETVTGDHADYDIGTGIVIILGQDVRLVRDKNTLDGQYAVVNLNTGISKLYPVPPGGSAGGQQRVKGFFVPTPKKDRDPTSAKGKEP